MACDPQTLITQSSCLQCAIPEAFQTPALVSLFAQINAQANTGAAIDSTTLVNLAKCVQCAVPEGEMLPILIYLVGQMGVKVGKITATDPQSLVTSAACLECRIPNGMNIPIMLNLWCSILNSGVFFSSSSYIYSAVAFKENDGKLRVFGSNDAVNYMELSESYQDPAPLRDPTIIYYNGKYWCAYSLNYALQPATFALASSPDGITWTKVTNVSVTGWTIAFSPTWFIDVDNSIHIVMPAFATPNTNTGGQIIEIHPTNSAMTSWSNPVLVWSGASSSIDPYITYVGGQYLMWFKNDFLKYIELAISNSPFTGYQYQYAGDWNGWGHGNVSFGNNGYEAPCMLQLQNGNWVLYVDSSVSNGMLFSTTTDSAGVHGWGPLSGVCNTYYPFTPFPVSQLETRLLTPPV